MQKCCSVEAHILTKKRNTCQQEVNLQKKNQHISDHLTQFQMKGGGLVGGLVTKLVTSFSAQVPTLKKYGNKVFNKFVFQKRFLKNLTGQKQRILTLFFRKYTPIFWEKKNLLLNWFKLFRKKNWCEIC